MVETLFAPAPPDPFAPLLHQPLARTLDQATAPRSSQGLVQRIIAVLAMLLQLGEDALPARLLPGRFHVALGHAAHTHLHDEGLQPIAGLREMGPHLAVSNTAYPTRAREAP